MSARSTAAACGCGRSTSTGWAKPNRHDAHDFRPRQYATAVEKPDFRRRTTDGFRTTRANRSATKRCATDWCASAQWSRASVSQQRPPRDATRCNPASLRCLTRRCRANLSRRQSLHGKSATYRPARSPAYACGNGRRPRRSRRPWVSLPNGETRQMEAGPSSIITKAVVEIFATRFLEDPAVLWISESGNKVVQRDDDLALSLGLKIETDKLLPDMILVDLAPAETLFLFVEAVATDGPITEARRGALLDLATGAGFKADQVAFVIRVSGPQRRGVQKGHPQFGLGFLRLVPERTGAFNRLRRRRAWRRSPAKRLHAAKER